MKKIVLLATTLAAAWSMTSCNSEGRDSGYGIVSFNHGGISGKSFTLFDGSGMTLTNASLITEDSDAPGREYCLMSWEYVDDTRPTGKGSKFNAEMVEGYRYTTRAISEEQAEYDDPIIMSLADIETVNRSPQYQLLDFFPFAFSHLMYDDNAGDKDNYSPVEFSFHDQEIIPGEKNDTISVRLNFFNNRKGEEKPIYIGNYDRTMAYAALDLRTLDLPISAEEKEYILKLNIKCFADSMNPDPNEGEVKMVYVLAKWNPSKPYSTDYQ